MELTRLPGETPWEAVVHDESMDIEEEEEFRQFCLENGCPEPENAPFGVLKNLLVDWRYERGDA